MPAHKTKELPFVVVTQRVAERIEQYRKASREATGAVTGFLGEIFGAVQAIKVAGAEMQIIKRFGALNDQRRVTGVRDKLFNEILESIFANAVHVGTGLILLLAATSMRAGTFTVGDFALFVYYLGWISEFTAMFGIVLARYRQAGVSFERMITLLQGAPPRSLVAHGPVYMREPLPDIPVSPRDAADRLHTIEATGLTFRYPESARGIEAINLRIARGSFTVLTGRIGSGKTTLLCTPELLVFDDLSSALDVETERALWERLLGIENAQLKIENEGDDAQFSIFNSQFWPSPTAAPHCAVPTGSSCCGMAASRPAARSTNCWRLVRRCAGCGPPRTRR